MTNKSSVLTQFGIWRNMMGKREILILFAFIIINILIVEKAQADNPIQVSVINPIQIVNSADSVKGMRLNLIYGVNENMSGLDFGLINKVNNCTSGMQLGLFNSSYEISGIQFGIINKTEYLNGLQIGLLNFNRSDNPHGFIPIINWSF